MKTTQKSIKKILLVGALALTMSMGMIGCSSNEKKPENTGNNVVEEEPANKQNNYLPGATLMTKEEVEEAFATGEVIFDNKDVENSVLDELNADRGYRYYMEVYDDANYSNLIDTDKEASFIYPTMLKNNDPELKWDNGKYYSKLVFSGEIILLSNVKYTQKDDSWYKISNLFSNVEHIGNKVVSEDKLKELNGNQKIK